jgi:hypothetical protein
MQISCRHQRAVRPNGMPNNVSQPSRIAARDLRGANLGANRRMAHREINALPMGYFDDDND